MPSIGRQRCVSCPFGAGSALSIEPRSKGLGYIASDGAGEIIGWGGFRTRPGRHKYYRSCARKLMRGYGPDFILVEDCDAPCSRRRPQTRKLIGLIVCDAKREGITVLKVKRRDVLKHFCRYGAGSSFDLAQAVCVSYPPLRSRLARRRKPWESEHYSTALFEAAARLCSFISAGSASLDKLNNQTGKA